MSASRRLSAVLVLVVAAQLACGAPAAVSTSAPVTTVPPSGTPAPPAATPDLALMLTQAAAGQHDLLERAHDIDELVHENRVNGRMRRLLSQVAVMKQYGEKHGLSATSNYPKYVRVDGREVVWVVSASEPLRFRSKSWSFPLVGNFTYLGWFKLAEARAFADDLKKTGWDVDVRGAGAYSTAGFFEDAVLSSMIK